MGATVRSPKYPDVGGTRDVQGLNALQSAFGNEIDGDVAVPELAIEVVRGAFGLATRPAEIRHDPAKWAASVVNRGLSQAYVADLRRCASNTDTSDLFGRVAQREADRIPPDMITRVLTSLPGLAWPDSHLLTDLVYKRIDDVLSQAVGLGRAGQVRHLEAVRIGHEVLILADGDPTRGWLLPTTKHRLHAEILSLGCDPDTMVAQSVDLTSGLPLRVFGAELRRTRFGRGDIIVRRLAGCLVSEPQAELGTRQSSVGRQWPRFGLIKRLAVVVRRPRPPVTRAVGSNAVFADQSDEAAEQLIAPRRPGLLGTILRTACATLGSLHAVKLRRKHVLCVLTAAARVRPSGARLAAAICAGVGLVCLGVAAGGLLDERSIETPAADMPDGFYVGRFNRGTLWEPDAVTYGLYLPPSLEAASESQPLLVFLHGYLPTERSLKKVMSVGLPRAIEKNEVPGRRTFPFTTLIPFDPTGKGKWEPAARETGDMLAVLDYVIERHRIDPDRVYLTGLSNGGGGVWRLVEAEPWRWAAVAAVSSAYRPARHPPLPVPAWIFHGAKDRIAPVASDRELVAELRALGAEVRYTEYPDRGHAIWDRAYSDPALYDWLGRQRRP